eukprot:15485214-Alexandrium_andersonii.AAC.1
MACRRDGPVHSARARPLGQRHSDSSAFEPLQTASSASGRFKPLQVVLAPPLSGGAAARQGPPKKRLQSPAPEAFFLAGWSEGGGGSPPRRGGAGSRLKQLQALKAVSSGLKALLSPSGWNWLGSQRPIGRGSCPSLAKGPN